MDNLVRPCRALYRLGVGVVATRRYYRVGPTFWTDHQWDDETRLAALYRIYEREA